MAALHMNVKKAFTITKQNDSTNQNYKRQFLFAVMIYTIVLTIWCLGGQRKICSIRNKYRNEFMEASGLSNRIFSADFSNENFPEPSAKRLGRAIGYLVSLFKTNFFCS